MSYSCKILLDSISETGKRLTTFEITFPRIVLAEFNTHRMFSRNSASSRAIPFKKQVEKIQAEPFIPEQFPVNCTGMQPQEYITEENGKEDGAYYDCVNWWLAARDNAIEIAENLSESWAIHKQICNRLLEPFMWHTVIVTATEFSNFFKLRCDENAQYEIRRIADLMYEAYHCHDNGSNNFISSVSKGIEIDWQAPAPQKLKVGEWHCPLVYEEDDELIREFWNKGTYASSDKNPYLDIKKKISVARTARVSYLTHDGKRDIEKDLELFERLRTSGHYSPFEHVATPSFTDITTINPNNKVNTKEFENGWQRVKGTNYFNLRNGNFIGWRQMRQDLPNENCTNFRKEN